MSIGLISRQRARQAELLVRLRRAVTAMLDRAEFEGESNDPDNQATINGCEAALMLVDALAACSLSRAEIEAAEDRLGEGDEA